MSGILFSSGINHLVGMRRSPVPGERPGGGPGPGPGGATSDYIGGVRTNADSGMVVWPYELTFDCFSGELGAVIEKFQSASEAFLVRSPMIEPAERVSAGVNRPAPPGRQFPPGRQITNAGPAPLLTTVVNERLMRVTLRVDVIRPESFQPGGPGPGPGNFRPGGGRGGRGGGPNQMNLPPGGGSGNPPPPAGGKP